MRLNLAHTMRIPPIHSAFIATACLAIAWTSTGCKDHPDADHDPASSLAGAKSNNAGAAATSGTGSDLAGSAATPSECGHAEGLDGPNAPLGTCRSAKAFLSCDIGDGATQLCVSDDPAHCPEAADRTQKSCTNRCTGNEYAVLCGGIMQFVEPPEGCVGAPTPGGVGLYCCPCLAR
jgi:hypothetical protein